MMPSERPPVALHVCDNLAVTPARRAILVRSEESGRHFVEKYERRFNIRKQEFYWQFNESIQADDPCNFDAGWSLFLETIGEKRHRRER